MKVKCCENCIYWDDFHKSLIVSKKFPCTMSIIPIKTEAKDYCGYYCPRDKGGLVDWGALIEEEAE